MKNLIQGIVCGLRGLAGVHFSYEELLAHRDGELGLLGRWCMNLHLSHCGICLREAALVDDDLSNFERVEREACASNPLDVRKSLGMLRESIRNWEATNPAARSAHRLKSTRFDSIRGQVESELGFYLGRPAAGVLIAGAESRKTEGRGLLQEAESALSDFLGPRAATSIRRKILFAQMLHHQTSHGSHLA